MSASAPATDQRALALRDLNHKYALPRFRNLQQWQARARTLRTHLLAVNGLLPMPVAPPLRPTVFGTVEHQDYAVSKVFFQSHPGLLVTGNLFVPRGKRGPFPAVLNPHGHWAEGRLQDDEAVTVLGRGISFARQGYVAFCYDMIGYHDSSQIGHSEESDRQRLWGLSQMALQLYNSMRAVDFLQSLPEVDPGRIGCTGESGGGTQTFMLMAVDPRIKVAAPVNMVSAQMQGGCVCENAPSLRLDTSNPEIAALMAPRPLLLVSATGDWTVNVPRYEFPFVRSIYALCGAAERVESVQFQAGHNYNRDSRNAVYRFFARWLLRATNLEAFTEQPYALGDKRDYLVFGERVRPSWAPQGEQLLDRIIARRRRQISAIWPVERREMATFRAQLGPAMAHLLMAQVPRPGEVKAPRVADKQIRGVALERIVLTRPAVGDRVPAYFLQPAARRASVATLVVSGAGKDALFDVRTGEARALVSDLLAAGQAVLLIDCWGVGEAAIPAERDQRPFDRLRAAPSRVEGRAARIKHYLTYNRSDDANRIQDILTALGYLRSRRSLASVNLVGLDRAGVWALLARTQAPFVAKTVVDLDRMEATDDSFLRRLLIPALRNIGDLTTAAALTAPGSLWLCDAGPAVQRGAAERAYQAAGKPQALRVTAGKLSPSQIADYLSRRSPRARQGPTRSAMPASR